MSEIALFVKEAAGTVTAVARAQAAGRLRPRDSSDLRTLVRALAP
jgi:hypothetical protein